MSSKPSNPSVHRMSRDDLISYFGEGIHTGLRKATDNLYAARAHQAITEMPDEDWRAVLEFAFQQIQKVVWKKPG